MKRATIKDVAAAAGVSADTVSRALDDRPEISPETKAKVRVVCETLGHVPNPAAKRKARAGRRGLFVSYFIFHKRAVRNLPSHQRLHRPVVVEIGVDDAAQRAVAHQEDVFVRVLPHELIQKGVHPRSDVEHGFPAGVAHRGLIAHAAVFLRRAINPFVLAVVNLQ